MLDFDLDRLGEDEDIYLDLTSIMVTSYKLLDHYRNRLKAFAGGMFYYYSFNVNLEDYLFHLGEFIREFSSPQDYARLMEDELMGGQVLDIEMHLNDLMEDDRHSIVMFLVLNYRFLEAYRDALRDYGRDIFSEVIYNNKLDQYVEDYKLLLEINLDDETLEALMADDEGILLKDGEYYQNAAD